MGKNWSELAKRHPKHRLLRAEAIYALPEVLIDTLESQQFLSQDEAVFERDLVRLGGVGFFRKALISFPWLPWNDVKVLDPKSIRSHQRAERTGAKIAALMRTEIRRAGRNDQQIEELERRQQAFAQRIRQRQRGYVGWLVTNHEFGNDRDRLRTLWEARPDARTTMPRLSWDLFGERRSRPPEDIAAAEAEGSKFLWKWGLASLATWELPVPLEPSFVGPSLHSLADQRSAGAVLFVPWHQLVDRDMHLDEVLDIRRLGTPLAHLDGWLRAPTAKRWGFRRFGTMLRLHTCLDLAIDQRYPGRMRGNISLLDDAFARFLSANKVDPESAKIGSVDTVSKVRTEMARRTQAAGPVRRRR
ncbi:MAG TPA: hypothetical protein VMR25_19495 [Planctomycetaceae bacterium]|jgi:hypothetical protein|nr:hypothetical protein [Planctomycetaceae bacterium]